MNVEGVLTAVIAWLFFKENADRQVVLGMLAIVAGGLLLAWEPGDARALVHMSRLEGGANVVIEAVRSRVPVLASRIDGNVGLLGRDYEGYFLRGDAVELVQLMQRVLGEPMFAERLQAQCLLREPMFDPAAEAAAVQALAVDMLSWPA